MKDLINLSKSIFNSPNLFVIELRYPKSINIAVYPCLLITNLII